MSQPTPAPKPTPYLFALLAATLILCLAPTATAEAPCTPQDAEGVGACDLFLGYTWDGQRCVGISGCSCKGADCDKLYEDLGACRKAHAHCRCAPQDARGEGACRLFLGWAWNGRTCTGLSGCQCVGSACDDLFKTQEKCFEAYRGCDCAPQDARGEGACDRYFGNAWNGSDCVSLSGCECKGSDCDNLYKTRDACLQAHIHCRCAPQDAHGVGACDLFLGVAWDGHSCVGISGCRCEGSDCDQLYGSIEECQRAHQGCRCAPQQARGEGACERILGVAWTGSRCVTLSGCSCQGADCGDLFPSEEACREAHQGCR